MREEREQLLLAMRERAVRRARLSLLDFTRYTFAQFSPASFHKYYYDLLTRFALGEFKKLMVFMPPQHGKSEGSTRRLPAYLLGVEPNLRLAIVSYSASKARKFNREIQRVIDSEEYRDIFPQTKLDDGSGAWLRNADECEVVGARGGFKTVGVGGALTGEPVDVLIMDDIYKDTKTAWSSTVRDSVDDWYDTVAETRLHNESRQLVVFTRWHEKDLAGRLLQQQGIFSEENPSGWVVISYPAIQDKEPTEHDPREIGEPLWPERHSLAKLNSIRERNSHVFASLYQQQPQPLEGLMYERGFQEWEVLPPTKRKYLKNYTDTADEGSDYLCSITYAETELGIFILDVIYTKKPMEYTEVAVAEMLNKHSVDVANIESNNGGRGFARAVERNLRTMGNKRTRVQWFAQRENKASRIFIHSAEVQNLVKMPRGWERLYPEFYQAVIGYMKVGNNAHDDAVDALTGVVEKMQQSSGTKSNTIPLPI